MSEPVRAMSSWLVDHLSQTQAEFAYFIPLVFLSLSSALLMFMVTFPFLADAP